MKCTAWGIQEMLKAEMDEHLGYEKHAPEGVGHSNSRNGYIKKKVKSNLGEVPLEVPRDRDGSFEPQLVPKRSRVMAEIEDNILSLYTHGMTVRDIESHVRELYGVEMSEATISHITDRVIDHIEQWKNRRLERVYIVGRSPVSLTINNTIFPHPPTIFPVTTFSRLFLLFFPFTQVLQAQ